MPRSTPDFIHVGPTPAVHFLRDHRPLAPAHFAIGGKHGINLMGP